MPQRRNPMDVHVKPDLAEERKEWEAGPAEYQAIVGSLMYIALATRLGISFAASALSTYSSRPLVSHPVAAKRMQRFLRSKAHQHFTSEGNSEIASCKYSVLHRSNGCHQSWLGSRSLFICAHQILCVDTSFINDHSTPKGL